MADGAASFLLEKLQAFPNREWNLQENIMRGLIVDLQLEMESMKAMMRDGDARKDHDNRFKAWIQEVRKQAYAIEDVLDLLRLQPGLRYWTYRHCISNLIKDITERLATIKETRKRYETMVSNPVAEPMATYLNETRIAALIGDDDDLVGMDAPRRELVSWAMEERNGTPLKVMFVVGMAGLGKTALARSVLERVKSSFDCHARVIASSPRSTDKTLRCLLEELDNSSEGSSTNSCILGLMSRLKNFLQHRRYFIIVDDLCAKDMWEAIRLSLPSGNISSRIIITTRRGDIADSCRNDDSIGIHKLLPLSMEASQQLFHKTALWRSTGGGPPPCEQVSGSILQICDGLPLAIIEMGRLLSSKPLTGYEWKKALDSLDSELKIGGGLSNTMEVLSSSYKDLPYRLKYCFLYMSIFPEKYPVRRRRLIRLWTAEGFVTEERGKTLEKVGEDYLNELIGRSLIKEREIDFDGRPKTVELHPLMHKIILSVSHEENFCTTVCADPMSTTDKPRRLSVQTGNLNSSQKLTTCRTFFSFSEGKVSMNQKFKLLKVLDIQGTPLETFPSAITDLLLLKYLSLRKTKIRSIPKSIGKLQHLETLDLKQTLVKKLPNAVLKLVKLRHLLVYAYKIMGITLEVQGVSVPKKIGTMVNLQTLSFLRAKRQHRTVEELRNLTRLRKLGIVEVARKDGRGLCQSIEKMRDLLSLSVASSLSEPLELHAMANPPRHLQRLYLIGPLPEFPKWVSSLHELVRISLKWSSLSRDNPVEALQDLPNLMELQLFDAYTGTQLDFEARKFPKLKILDIERLKRLRFIVMEDDTLPCLEKLIIRQCDQLEQVPVGVDSLSRLNQLLLCDMPENFVAPLRRNGGLLRHLVARIPIIRSYQKGQLVEDLS